MHTIVRVCRWLGGALGVLILVLLAGFGLLQTQAGKTWLAGTIAPRYAVGFRSLFSSDSRAFSRSTTNWR